ncbi:hypothetical protein CN311_15980 [Mesorhizobium sanjuanii]|uniref:Orc1-like AAA ATPase domain-containing protein n=1 Tax=Mesorhizobium sanjuanii TaxID=2037900 RepID=A0A2A6FEG7_9HYPH|nr:hypothetical protein [Mesorhizobium sanjuanii]PDQ20115.1 hypothetical protein CN311_15980 [Mesorhizobium sanjuanii]
MELPLKACWNAEDVSRIISNEALEGHEGVFLATHTPIAGFSVSGSHAGEIEEPTEEAVLWTLSDPGRRHAFCVVQGEPGSGKSHLIRWLSVNWLEGRDVKLLLQRADGSLEGALRQLRECLPAEFQELFDKLGRPQKATAQGRARQLLGNLASSAHPDHFDPPLGDQEWCKTNRPDQLLSYLHLRDNWTGPSRILRLMDGRGAADSDSRNSQSASFNLFDMEELADCCAGIANSSVSLGAERLALRLTGEAATIEDLKNAGWSAEEIEREKATELPASMALMNALNRRRNDAVQSLIGVSAAGLKSLFRQIREVLAARGQRLVLLLEDITTWEGFDDSLTDVLVTNAETRGGDGESDMCPLISVVGITPKYRKDLAGNYLGRITHEISLGLAQHEGDLQDVATLRDEAMRHNFVARYLAAIRTGDAGLKAWRERRREDPDLPPPNRCEACPVQEGCHAVFGKIDGIGLFPFTADAFGRFYDALNERDSGMTWKTPRGILQAVLSPNLAQPQAIETGAFPTPLMESHSLRPETRLLSAQLNRMVEVGLEGNQRDQARMRRVLAYWGDPNRADVTRLDNGQRAFARVPEGVFTAFHLPWIGSDMTTVRQEPLRVVPVERPTDVVPELVQTPAQGQDPVTQRDPPRRPTQVEPPPSRRNAPNRSMLERARDQVRAWRESGAIESPKEMNDRLYEIVCAIDPRRIGLDPHSFKRLFTQEQVKIEGTGPSQRSYFSVTRADWAVAGLEAYLELSLNKAIESGAAAFNGQALALMMRRLEALARDYADRRLSRLSDGSRWSPVAACVQVLLARAWLRGTVAADAPPNEQMRAILSDEKDAKSDPMARCEPWQKYLNITDSNRLHASLREGLREMLGTPQGDSKNFGLADVSLAAGAIRRLRDTLRFDLLPGDAIDTGVKEFDKVREIIASFEGGLTRIVRVEKSMIIQRAQTLLVNLRGRSIEDHLSRIDQVVDAVSAQLRSAETARVAQWKQEYNRIKPRLLAGAPASVEQLLLDVEGDAQTAVDHAATIAWLARAPARDLEELRLLSQTGEDIIEKLLIHVRECVAEGAGKLSLSSIHQLGVKLATALNPSHRNSPEVV